VSAPGLAPRGWLHVVAALSITEIVSWGVLYYAFGVLVAPMQAELGWSQGFLGAAFGLALLGSAVLAGPIARAFERFGPRAVMSIGSSLGALLVFAWSRVETRTDFLLLFLALSFPLASTLYEAAFSALVGFLGSGRRTDAALLGLTIVAGLASTVFVPLTQALAEARGWRGALVILAFLLGAVTIPLHATLAPRRIRSLEPDERRGLDGMGREERRLRSVAAAFALATAAATALGVYLVPILLEQGFSPGRAAITASLVGVGQVLGRVAFTWLRPRHSLRAWSVLLFAPPALALLALAAEPSPWAAGAGVLAFAAAAGAQTLGRTAFALELFPVASFARVNAVLGRWSLVGRAAAPFLLGAGHDLAGSHRAGLLGLALACTLGGWLAWRASERSPRS
jgi:predicted MFS family arabinose efflux permease